MVHELEEDLSRLEVGHYPMTPAARLRFCSHRRAPDRNRGDAIWVNRLNDT